MEKPWGRLRRRRHASSTASSVLIRHKTRSPSTRAVPKLSQVEEPSRPCALSLQWHRPIHDKTDLSSCVDVLGRYDP
eukprot:1782268-Pyramimonas_sp.AAC.1